MMKSAIIWLIREYEYDKIALGKGIANLKETAEIKLTSAVILPQDEHVKVTIEEDRLKVICRFILPVMEGIILPRRTSYLKW